MFVTTESMRIPSLLPHGVHLWKAMEIELLLPILMVSMTQRETETELPLASTFVVLPDHLATLLAAPEFILDHVDLLSPARINGSGRWMLEPLQALWKCSEPESETVAWLFDVPGSQYTESIHGTLPNQLKRDRCVFDVTEGEARKPFGCLA